uniref:KIB1-4 beta-propeller domain-containing protein n=3 Tax=Noccaea caerulescens TaxID=107243 RepID=A0A1J3GFK7_NOCCA
MRSLLLLSRRLSKLSSPRNPHFVLSGVRFLSETPLCHIVGAEPCGSTSRDGEIGRLVITACRESFWQTRTVNKKVPMSLMAETATIGASHGWVATLKDGVVCLQDDLIPSASDSDPKRISLPPLQTLPHCQTQLVTNVAMSSASPDKDEDCILAVKFLGPQLSLCRPALGDKAEWVNIRVEDPGFFSSRVMYSKRDRMFSMPGSGGKITGSWDLEKHRDKPKLVTWQVPILHEYVQSEWEVLDTCSTTEQLVESRPTGEMFMVKRFRERNNFEGGRMEDRQMMVFKLVEYECLGKAFPSPTTDIGDLCIFLSKSEPFCLKASSYGHLRPNSVYYIDDNEMGIFDIERKLNPSGISPYPAPYYIPPQSYLDAYGK